MEGLGIQVVARRRRLGRAQPHVAAALQLRPSSAVTSSPPCPALQGCTGRDRLHPPSHTS